MFILLFFSFSQAQHVDLEKDTITSQFFFSFFSESNIDLNPEACKLVRSLEAQLIKNPNSRVGLILQLLMKSQIRLTTVCLFIKKKKSFSSKKPQDEMADSIERLILQVKIFLTELKAVQNREEEFYLQLNSKDLEVEEKRSLVLSIMSEIEINSNNIEQVIQVLENQMTLIEEIKN